MILLHANLRHVLFSPLFYLLHSSFFFPHKISSVSGESAGRCIWKYNPMHLTEARSILWLSGLLGRSFVVSALNIFSHISRGAHFSHVSVKEASEGSWLNLVPKGVKTAALQMSQGVQFAQDREALVKAQPFFLNSLFAVPWPDNEGWDLSVPGTT